MTIFINSKNCFWQTIKFIYFPCLELCKTNYYSKTCLCVQLASIRGKSNLATTISTDRQNRTAKME